MSGFRRICAWCPTPHEMGPAPDGSTGDTHGACAAAALKMRAELDAFRAGKAKEPCPGCKGHPWEPGVPAWVVCFWTGRPGEFRHEGFAFGNGSPLTEPQAEVWARTWAATDLKRAYPKGRKLAIRRVPAGA